jgi:hypothetical protein
MAMMCPAQNGAPRFPDINPYNIGGGEDERIVATLNRSSLQIENPVSIAVYRKDDVG